MLSRDWKNGDGIYSKQEAIASPMWETFSIKYRLDAKEKSLNQR